MGLAGENKKQQQIEEMERFESILKFRRLQFKPSYQIKHSMDTVPKPPIFQEIAALQFSLRKIASYTAWLPIQS